MKTLISIAFCFVACGAAASAQQPKSGGTKQNDPPPAAAKKVNSRPAAGKAGAPAAEPFDRASIEKMAAQCVRLETEAGSVELEMLPETAAETVRNFLNLIALGAYDTTEFHRVVPGFVVQSGSLATRLKKTSAALAKRAERALRDEPNAVLHERGIVSMARTSAPDSATTQFFILVRDAKHLDGTFAAFGRVTGGMEVVDEINKAPVEGDKPKKPVRLTRAALAPCTAPPEPNPVSN